MSPYYITVTNKIGATIGSDPQPVATTFRMYIDEKKGECIGYDCLMRALNGDRTATGSILQLMLADQIKEWRHLSWERK